MRTTICKIVSLLNFCENSLFMTAQELTDLLIENISMQLRHANYDRCIKVRKFAKMITTGEGQEDEVTRYRRFEEDTLKEQRMRLYNPLTKYALSRPRKYWKRMHRVEGIRRTFTVEKTFEKTLTDLQNDLYNFMPGEGLEQWLNRTLEYYGVTDPNAWIVYERADRRNIEGIPIKTTVYPLIFSCENVLNFQKSFGVLDWLIVRNVRFERTVKGGSSEDTMLEDFLLYAPGLIVRVREAGKKTAMELGEVSIDVPMYYGQQGVTDPTGRSGDVPAVASTKTRKFYLKVIENGSKEVPADCVGVYFDEVTGQDSFVPWFDPAENVFNDLIHEKSIADTLLTVYAYPKETVYTKACKFRHPDMGECVGGYFNDIHDRDHLCTSCNGTGRMAGFTTEQAKIELILPDGASSTDLIELSKLSYTQPIDIALLEWIDGKLDKTEARIMAAVFDSGLVQRTTNTTTKTATEVNAIMEGISDVLAPFGAVDSRHFELCYRVFANYRGFVVDVDKSYPDDLKIEMLGDMVASFDDIKTAGVGYEATVAQRNRVFQKLFEGNPIIQQQIAARYKFLPFDDKTPEQAAMIISGLSAKDPVRVRWTYWRDIFAEIESVDSLFYQKTYKLQQSIVDAKVQEFADRIMEVDMGGGDAPSFNVGEIGPGEIGNDPVTTKPKGGTLPTVNSGQQFEGAMFELKVNGAAVNLNGVGIEANFEGPTPFALTLGKGVTVINPDAGVFQIDPQTIDAQPGNYTYSILFQFETGKPKEYITGTWEIL